MFHPEGPTFLELAVQALSSTDRGYDLLAPKFEHTPFRTPDVVLEACASRIAEGGRVKRALDLCCGTGAGMRAMRRICDEVVVGVDRSAGMLAQARRSSDGAGEPAGGKVREQERGSGARLELVRGDVLELPCRGSFDLVTCFGALGHIRERDEPRLVDAVARALRPGGRFAFITSDRISPLQPAFWLAHGFNAAMRLRNALLKPEFVMYYLTFLVPRARALLEARGLDLVVHRGLFPKPYRRWVLGVATQRP